MFSDPVIGSNFFGRQEIIDLLIKRASGLKSGYRQNIAVIGHRQLGKTSLLQQFLHTFKDPQVISVYVEIKPQALDYFVDQFVRSLLYQVLVQSQSIDPLESLASLMEKSKPLIPKTVERIEEISALLKRRHAEEAYSRLFELTSIASKETGKFCIVILDEFHRLGDFGIRNAFSDFGRRIMVQKETMYLLSSSSFSVSRKILAEKLSLLFGHFERVYLEPFNFETCYQFLENKLLPIEIPQNLKSFLAAFTDGQPFYLNMISHGLAQTAKAKQEQVLSRQTISEVLQKLLYESQGALNQYFLSLISPWTQKHSHGSHLMILMRLASGIHKLKDLSEAVNRSQRETSRHLEELMAHELVLKNGVFYRFHDKMFKFWLKEVYERKELSLLNAAARENDFLMSVDKKIGEYEEFLTVGSTDRIAGLFRCFQNDIIEFGEKKRKLPHFTEFLPGAMVSGGEDSPTRELIAKGHGRCWVCKITEEKATEKEVLDLLSRKSGDSKKSSTGVLVALGGLDENAKLLAKEKKIFTLGLSRINVLMDLYGQFPIVK